jgi:hypothetical protein
VRTGWARRIGVVCEESAWTLIGYGPPHRRPPPAARRPPHRRTGAPPPEAHRRTGAPAHRRAGRGSPSRPGGLRAGADGAGPGQPAAAAAFPVAVSATLSLPPAVCRRFRAGARAPEQAGRRGRGGAEPIAGGSPVPPGAAACPAAAGCQGSPVLRCRVRSDDDCGPGPVAPRCCVMRSGRPYGRAPFGERARAPAMRNRQVIRGVQGCANEVRRLTEEYAQGADLAAPSRRPDRRHPRRCSTLIQEPRRSSTRSPSTGFARAREGLHGEDRHAGARSDRGRRSRYTSTRLTPPSPRRRSLPMARPEAPR